VSAQPSEVPVELLALQLILRRFGSLFKDDVGGGAELPDTPNA
jgi:hypothetical protein